MTELLNLGQLYISDFLADGEQPRADPAELRLVMDDDTGIVHLAGQPSSDQMWGQRYWYRSGTNQSMRDELHGIVHQIEHVANLEPGDVWVDIACNDGTLLSEIRHDLVRIGVDPVEGDIHNQSLEHAELIVQEPFTRAVAERLLFGGGHAKVVTCIAMFYDLLDPSDFLAGIHHLLDRDGLFVLQMSYTPLMLDQLAFDNLCHEHARYYTLATLSSVLDDAGFAVVDVSLNDTNGGSFRVYAMRDDADRSTFATQPYRDVADMRIRSLLVNERDGRYNEPAVWQTFWNRLSELRGEVVRFIQQARAGGQTVAAYGASTKGNTLLQYFGLDHTLIDFIAERQPGKVGLRTVGTDIPIVSEDHWRNACPDYTLMLPWHFIGSFLEREADYLKVAQFIVPCPRFELIGDGPDAVIGDGRKPA